MRLVSVQVEKGKSRLSLSSITIANLKSLSFYVTLATLIAGILFNIFLGQTMGIIMFCFVIMNVGNVYKIISQITLIYADTFYLKQYSRLIVLFGFNIVFAHLIATVLQAISFINGTGQGWKDTFVS